VKAAREGTPPKINTSNDAFSDSILSETIADDLMTDKPIWVKGLGWMTWDGRKWFTCSDESVIEDVRQYCVDQLTLAVEALKSDSSLHPVVDGWRSMLKRHRVTAVMGFINTHEGHRDRSWWQWCWPRWSRHARAPACVCAYAHIGVG
jgi:hypothetical protein